MAPDTVTGPRTTRAERPSVAPRPSQPRDATAHEGRRAAQIVQAVGPVRFVESLLHLSRPRIELQAARLDARRNSPDDDIAWWDATMALNRALRRRGTGRRAAMAARLASEAVLTAANRTGLTLDSDVIAVARSAGEVARLLITGDLHSPAAGYLARGWEDLLAPPADPPSPSGPAGGRGHLRPRTAANQPQTGRRT